MFKMRLLTLYQFICDTCGEIIQCPQEGYVQFRQDEDGRYCDFVIVHHKSVSPRGPDYDCYQHGLDWDLEYFLGPAGVNHLLSLADPQGHSVVELTSWLELFRRLQIPYYEEARPYFDDAIRDGFISDGPRAYLYPDLSEIAEQYGATR